MLRMRAGGNPGIFDSMSTTLKFASVSLIACLGIACNGDDSATSDSDSATSTGTPTSTTASASDTMSGSESASATETTTVSGSESNSATDSTSATDTDPTATATDTDPTATATDTDPTATATDTDPTAGTDTDPTSGTDTEASASDTDMPMPVCGDGVVEGDEVCDDGNNENGDGCQADCTLPCLPGDGGMMGEAEKSYLWVANTSQGSISKVDTMAVTELARYRSGPNGGSESPSRTAVSLDGRYVVVNNRASGRVTMIAANAEDCKNGGANTSQNKDDLLAWGTDDCVIWSTVLPIKGGQSTGPRAVTWTPGDWNDDPDVCAFENPKVWVGYLPAPNATASMARFNGADGTIEETVNIGNWSVGWANYSPYGAALDKLANVWFTGLRGEVFRINTSEDPITFDRWNPPGNLQFYGMTVDPEGEPWFGGCSGPVSTFNPETQQFTAIAGTQACHRGLAADQVGNVWVASNGPCGLVQIDYETNTLIKFHTPAQCSTPVGVSVDIEGYVWLVDQAGWAWKIDPENPEPNNWQQLTIAGNHYTYSDMTGGQGKSVILPQ